jgi:hypothetical protein
VHARWSPLVVFALTLGLAVADARPALAGTAALKRAVENATQGPLDILLSPVVAFHSAYLNTETAETTAGRTALRALAFPSIMFFDWMASGFRTWAGAMEIPVGVAVLLAGPVKELEPPVFFDADKSPALVDHETAIFHFKFGAYHIANQNVRR